MPLDLPVAIVDSNAMSEENSDQRRRATNPSLRLIDVFEMLRMARETQSISGQQIEVSSISQSGDVQSGGVERQRTARDIRPSDVIRPDSSVAASISQGNEDFRPLSITAPRQVYSPGTLQRERDDSDSLAMSSGSLLRRELEGEDVLSRWSSRIPNSRSIHDELERTMDEHSIPFSHGHIDAHISRNHHRHSSMSTSPRVLDGRSSSSLSNLRHEPTRYKLEDVLRFLLLQRLPPRHIGNPLYGSFFKRSLIAESSWLRPGSSYHGVQTSGEEPLCDASSSTRQVRRSKEWKMDIVIHQVNYSNMSIAGSMTTYAMPESRERKTTFWTGDVRAFMKCNAIQLTSL